MKQLSPENLGTSQMRPRRQTMAFIRQFARAYSCSASLPPALGAFIAN